MKQKVIPYGTTHLCEVVSASKFVIIVTGDDNEGYILIGHGMKKLPEPGDKGKIVFEMGGATRTRGHWKYYPTQQ